MPEPIETQVISKTILCDVPGCGRIADYSTDGSEVDVHTKRTGQDNIESGDEELNRPAIAHVNVCDMHHNWPHSEDAKRFSSSIEFQARVSTLGVK